MATTTNRALRYPLATAAPNIPQDIQNLATDVDTALLTPGAICTSTTRPAAPTAGMVIYETDTGRSYRWIPSGVVVLGTALASGIWDQISGPPEQYSLAFAAGFQGGAGSYGPMTAYKLGRQVWLQGQLDPVPGGTSLSTGTAIKFATIPAQVIPTANEQGAATFYAGTGGALFAAWWIALTTGDLDFGTNQSPTSSTAWQLSLTGAHWLTRA